MFEDLKKKILKSQLVFTIIVILLGLGLAGWNAANAYYAIFGYADFKSLAPDKIRGQLVEVDLTENFGSYLKVTKTTTRSSGSTSKTVDYYYLIWTGDDNADEWRYMSIKVPQSYASQMNKMADSADAGYSSDPIHFYGKIKKLSGENYDTFREIFEKDGWTDAEIAEGTLPYCINTFANKTAMNVMYILLFAAGAFLTVFGVFRITKVASGGSLKKLREDITSAGYTESMADADYRAAVSYNKKGDIKIGRLMIYYLSGDNARAIPNSKIMWAYQNTVTHRTNGVKTGTTYNLMLFDELFPKGHTMSVDNESVVQAMLKQIVDTLPWVVVGYSDELSKAYNKNRAQFLNLRYNLYEHVAVEPGTVAEQIGDALPGVQM